MNEGQLAVITRENCPACMEFKSDPNVQKALETGELIEISESHREYERAISTEGVDVLPHVIEYRNGSWVSVQ